MNKNMTKIYLLIFTTLACCLAISAQDLKQVIPNCEQSKVIISNDAPPNLEPQILIYQAAKEMKPTISKKVKAKYPKDASASGIHGTVLLSVVFHANGKIGNIRVIMGLPNGLSEAAIEAAKQVVFKPAEKDGVPISVRMSLEYGFNIERLGKARIANILKTDFTFLNAETREKMTIKYEKLKIGSNEIDIRPFRDEARGLTLFDSGKRNDFLQLRDEGLRNLCPSDQEAYEKLVKEIPILAETDKSQVDEYFISYKVSKLFGFRHSGIRTLPVEKQKRFVELYNEAILQGLDSAKR